MHEPAQPTQQCNDLRYQAILYAAGEMHPTAAEAFETRLGSDADAQHALVQAVQLAGLLDGRSYTPDPAYRDAVRETVLAGCRKRRRSTLLWIGSACAAAVALVAIWLPLQRNAATNKSFAVLPPEHAIVPSTKEKATSVAINESANRADSHVAAAPAPDADDATDAEETLAPDDGSIELSIAERLRLFLENEQRRQLRLRLLPGDLRIERLPPPEVVE